MPRACRSRGAHLLSSPSSQQEPVHDILRLDNSVCCTCLRAGPHMTDFTSKRCPTALRNHTTSFSGPMRKKSPMCAEADAGVAMLYIERTRAGGKQGCMPRPLAAKRRPATQTPTLSPGAGGPLAMPPLSKSFCRKPRRRALAMRTLACKSSKRLGQIERWSRAVRGRPPSEVT